MYSIFIILLCNSFVSCKADLVGVFLPPTGVQSVSYQDLDRDMRQVFKGRGDWVSKRMTQMGWTKVLDTSEDQCFISALYDTSPLSERLTYTFDGNKSDWSHVIHLASMLSVAKGLSSCDIPVVLCKNRGSSKKNTMTSFFSEQKVQKPEDVDILQLESAIKAFLISEVGCQRGEVP